MRTLLFDSDILLNRFTVYEQSSVDWDGDGDSRTYAGNIESAVQNCVQFINRVQEECKADRVAMVFSGYNVFRKDLTPTYKANRTGSKPLLLPELRKRLTDMYVTFEEDKLEADDLLGLLATNGMIEGEVVIGTIDKDLLQIPTMVYNWDKKKMTNYSYIQGAIWFYTQALLGDRIDNYKGCWKVGEKTVGSVLEGAYNEYDMFDQALAAFYQHCHPYEYALLQFRLARILRGDEYNFHTKEIKLWIPPSPPSK